MPEIVARPRVARDDRFLLRSYLPSRRRRRSRSSLWWLHKVHCIQSGFVRARPVVPFDDTKREEEEKEEGRGWTLACCEGVFLICEPPPHLQGVPCGHGHTLNSVPVLQYYRPGSSTSPWPHDTPCTTGRTPYPSSLPRGLVLFYPLPPSSRLAEVFSLDNMEGNKFCSGYELT